MEKINKNTEARYDDLKGKKLNLLKKYEIQFTKPHAGFSEGYIQKVSEFAFGIYVDKLKVAKEIR